jgi:20S proteasome alpha/beta subunit
VGKLADILARASCRTLCLAKSRQRLSPFGLWRLPETKPVTLIAGLKCADGIVLAADTEESTSLTRGRARKLLSRTFQKGKNTLVVAVAGAGSAPLIDAAVEQIFDAIETSKGSRLNQLKKVISDALLVFYSNHVSVYPSREPFEKVIDLICGVRGAGGELALYKTSGPLLSTVTGFVLSGSGEILRHIVEELYEPTIAVPRAVALALHMLNLGKRYLAGVGGDSEILTLTAQGIPIQEQTAAVEIKESHLDLFNRRIGELLLQFPDSTITPESFATAMAQVSDDVRRLRERQTEKLAELSVTARPGLLASPANSDVPTPPSLPASRSGRSRKAPRK